MLQQTLICQTITKPDIKYCIKIDAGSVDRMSKRRIIHDQIVLGGSSLYQNYLYT